jgi:hypothetical protein
MARFALHGIWQQKHPTPTHAGWEFHWHVAPPLPPEVAAAVTGRLAALDLALAGEASGVAFAPGWVAWARSFSAEAPSEQRGYVGLAGMVAVGEHLGAWLPGVLAALELPPAAPFSGDPPARRVEAAAIEAAPVEARDFEAVLPLARVCVAGGRAAVDAPGDAGWPRRLGRLLAWLPAEARVRPRQALLALEARARPAGDVDENIAHYLARGWTHPEGLSAWRLLAASGRPLVELFAWLGELSAAWDSPAALERWLRAQLGAQVVARCDAAAPAPLFAPSSDAGMSWNRVVHYWGRGFLSGAEERLARVLAGRVLVDHLVRLDGGDADLPLRYLRRLRYESLVPAPRLRVLADAVRRELPGVSH